MNDVSRRKYVFAFATQYSSVRLKVRGPGASGLSGVQRFCAYSAVKLPMSPDSVRKYCTASKAAWKNTLTSKFFTCAASLQPPVNNFDASVVFHAAFDAVQYFRTESGDIDGKST